MAKTSARFLIVSAWEPEQRVLRQVLHGPSEGTPSPLSEPESVHEMAWRERFGRAELERLGRQVVFGCLGVGVFQALEFLCGWLKAGAAEGKTQPLLCFTGTGGIVGKKFTQPFAELVKAVFWYDPRVVTQHAYVPPQMEREMVFRSEVDEDDDLPKLTCLGTFGITCNSSDQAAAVGALREKLALSPSEDFVENLELYAVARAAARFGLKWRAQIGVSNETGPLAHEQWKSHHIQASCLAQEQLLSALMRIKRSEF